MPKNNALCLRDFKGQHNLKIIKYIESLFGFPPIKTNYNFSSYMRNTLGYGTLHIRLFSSCCFYYHYFLSLLFIKNFLGGLTGVDY